MKIDGKNIVGWLLFILGSILYSAEQSYVYFIFSNVASQIIWEYVCYFLIILGIAFTVFEFEGMASQIATGLMSITISIFLLNAFLLIIDGATGEYDFVSTDYCYLIMNTYNLTAISDTMALCFAAISLPFGLLIWAGLSRNEMQFWYDVMLYAVICIALSWLFPWLNGIAIFGVW
jgi:hypothetical protein